MSEPSTYEAAMVRIAQLEAELRISEDARAIANKLRARPDDALLDRIRTIEAALLNTPCPKVIRPDYGKVGAYLARWCVSAKQCDCGVSAALSAETPESLHLVSE